MHNFKVAITKPTAYTGIRT